MSCIRNIYLAGGCYWGTQHFLKMLSGVMDTEVGFANGKQETPPTYEAVCQKDTGFAETVRVAYDQEMVALSTLLERYFMTIDPTSINQQGGDKGTQYRTGIYYTQPEDLAVIETCLQALASKHTKPIAIEVEPLRAFFPATEEHQDYLEKNPQGYCHISPELFEIAKNLP